MNKDQYRDAIYRLGLSQGAAAAFLGVSIRTSWGYANGKPIPLGYAKLLRLMIERGIQPADVH